MAYGYNLRSNARLHGAGLSAAGQNIRQGILSLIANKAKREAQRREERLMQMREGEYLSRQEDRKRQLENQRLISSAIRDAQAGRLPDTSNITNPQGLLSALTYQDKLEDERADEATANYLASQVGREDLPKGLSLNQTTGALDWLTKQDDRRGKEEALENLTDEMAGAFGISEDQVPDSLSGRETTFSLLKDISTEKRAQSADERADRSLELQENADTRADRGLELREDAATRAQEAHDQKLLTDRNVLGYNTDSEMYQWVDQTGDWPEGVVPANKAPQPVDPVKQKKLEMDLVDNYRKKRTDLAMKLVNLEKAESKDEFAQMMMGFGLEPSEDLKQQMAGPVDDKEFERLKDTVKTHLVKEINWYSRQLSQYVDDDSASMLYATGESFTARNPQTGEVKDFPIWETDDGNFVIMAGGKYHKINKDAINKRNVSSAKDTVDEMLNEEDEGRESPGTSFSFSNDIGGAGLNARPMPGESVTPTILDYLLKPGGGANW